MPEVRPVINDSLPVTISIQFWFKQILKVDEGDQILTIYCWLEEVCLKKRDFRSTIDLRTEANTKQRQKFLMVYIYMTDEKIICFSIGWMNT